VMGAEVHLVHVAGQSLHPSTGRDDGVGVQQDFQRGRGQ
jgi:hypothetical protein